MPEIPPRSPPNPPTTEFPHHSPPPKEHQHEFHGHEVSSWSHRYVSAQAEKEKEDFRDKGIFDFLPAISIFGGVLEVWGFAVPQCV